VEVFSHFFPGFGPVTIRLENVEWETDLEPRKFWLLNGKMEKGTRKRGGGGWG
jgi:hypothetical protein